MQRLWLIVTVMVVSGNLYAAQVSKEAPSEVAKPAPQVAPSVESKKDAATSATAQADAKTAQETNVKPLPLGIFGAGLLKGARFIWGDGEVALSDLRAGELRHSGADESSQSRTIERAVVDFSRKNDFRSMQELIEKAQRNRIKITEQASITAIDLYDRSKLTVINQAYQSLEKMLLDLKTIQLGRNQASGLGTPIDETALFMYMLKECENLYKQKDNKKASEQ